MPSDLHVQLKTTRSARNKFVFARCRHKQYNCYRFVKMFPPAVDFRSYSQLDLINKSLLIKAVILLHKITSKYLNVNTKIPTKSELFSYNWHMASSIARLQRNLISWAEFSVTTFFTWTRCHVIPRLPTSGSQEIEEGEHWRYSKKTLKDESDMGERPNHCTGKRNMEDACCPMRGRA